MNNETNRVHAQAVLHHVIRARHSAELLGLHETDQRRLQRIAEGIYALKKAQETFSGLVAAEEAVARFEEIKKTTLPPLT